MVTSAPTIRTVGFDGFLVTFGNSLSEATNRSALAFRAAVDVAGLDGVLETSTSLVSAYIRFDPLSVAHDRMQSQIEALLADRDWSIEPISSKRTLWRVPVALGGDAGPQLAEAAALAGMSEEEAIQSITGTRLRVQTIGFAPGMPYLGELPLAWDIPRQSQLTAQVPRGGLCVAIRQMVLFPNQTPTGWRHIGQTRIRLFRPESERPFVLSPGDEVAFESVSIESLEAIGDDPDGGAVPEALT